MLLLANAMFMVGSLIAALSVNLGMLLVGRVIQGTAGGGLLTLVDIAISDLFSLRTRGTYLGLVALTWAVASAVGPIIGGMSSVMTVIFISVQIERLTIICRRFYLSGILEMVRWSQRLVVCKKLTSNAGASTSTSLWTAFASSS